MSRFDVQIDKEASCDTTIDEVLKSVEFQNTAGNLLVAHQIQATKVVLTYEGQ